jgi:Cys-tRNA(Pro) deacylase
MHPNVDRVVEAGRQLGVAVTPQEFPEGTRTAADAAAAIGVALGQIVKTLVFVAGEQPVVALVSGSNQLDERKLAAMLGNDVHVHRPDAKVVRDATGYPIGGVPPFGHRLALPVFIDADLLAYDEVWAACGTPHVNFAITPDVLARATAGRVGDLAKRR